MNRFSDKNETLASAKARTMFGKALALWTMDLLQHPPAIDWRKPEADPIADYKNNDWTLLYNGSILDD